MSELEEPGPRRGGHLRLARLAAGLSQRELGERTGLSPQAISGIEGGHFAPSLDAALRLAASLGASVEELFAEPQPSRPLEVAIVEDDLAHRPPARGARVAIATLQAGAVGFELSGDRSLLPGFLPAGGILLPEGLAACPPEGARDQPHTRSSTSGAPANSLAQERGRGSGLRRAGLLRDLGDVLVVAGCDPALALLAGPLSRFDPPVGLFWWPSSNAVATELAASGLVHAAGVHHARSEGLPAGSAETRAGRSSGASERRRTESIRGGRARPRGPDRVPDAIRVGFAHWREGLVLSPGLSREVADLRDVARSGLHLANREVGSEARRLLDAERERFGIRAADLANYETSCRAHLLVASAIACGLAQVGVASEPAGLAYDLDFIAWQEESCEILIARNQLGTTPVHALLSVLRGDSLRNELGAIPGYDPSPCGEPITAGRP